MDEQFIEETSIDDAVEAMLKASESDEGTPSDELDEDQGDQSDADEAQDEGTEDEAPEGDTDESEESDEDADDEETVAKKVAGDDDEVEITVDGKQERASVKDLKRLFGQEKALTQKSQALAEQKTTIERQGLLAMQTLQRQIDKAQARFKPYAEIDFNLAATKLDEAEYKALKEEAKAAYDDVKFFETEATELLKTYDEGRKAVLKTQAQEAIRAINDPSSRFHIEGWNDALYNDIRTYGVQQGLDRKAVNEMVDPASLKILQRLKAYDDAAAAAAKTKEAVKTKVAAKVAKAPKKALGKSTTHTTSESKTLTKLRQAAATTGSLDDVVALMVAASGD
jgi:hypothetical protein